MDMCLKYFLCRIAILLMLVWVVSCQKPNHAYKEFLKGGERVYVAKADSLQAFPGKNRVQLQWLLLSDPTVRSAKIYWNNRMDSLELPLEKGPSVDTVSVVVAGLEEGGHNFEVITLDGKGNTSVVQSVFG